jgi:hypothetical protein
MKDGVYGDTETGVAVIAMMAVLIGRNAVGTAVRTDRFALPANRFNVADAIFFGGEPLVNLDDVHGYLLLGRLQYPARGKSCQEKSATLN